MMTQEQYKAHDIVRKLKANGYTMANNYLLIDLMDEYRLEFTPTNLGILFDTLDKNNIEYYFTELREVINNV